MGYPPSGPGLGTSPKCGQTDRHVSKHNLPLVVRTRSVIKKASCVNAGGIPPEQHIHIGRGYGGWGRYTILSWSGRGAVADIKIKRVSVTFP